MLTSEYNTRVTAPSPIVSDASFAKGLNRKTTRELQGLMNQQVLGQVQGILRSGKEANIFYGETPTGKECAIKIYKTNMGGLFRSVLIMSTIIVVFLCSV
jgi:hypothetical protein